jgi:uncharacterized protein YjgD (DUF1641 family)
MNKLKGCFGCGDMECPCRNFGEFDCSRRKEYEEKPHYEVETEDIIRQLIKKAHEIMPQRTEVDEILPKQFDEEHKTIRLRLPRQSGQTTSVLNVTSEMFKQVLYISQHEMSKWAKDYCKNNKIKNVKFITTGGLDRIRGNQFDCVIVDNYDFLEFFPVDHLYELIGPISKNNDKFLYFLIG